LGPYFLAAIGLTLAGSLVLMVDRRSILATSSSSEGLLSRDGMFFLTLLLFLTLTASVLVGSVLPTITEALTGQRFEAGPAWFDRVTGPQFAVLALVMGVCPLLGRAAVALRRLRGRGLPALVGAVLVTAVGALAGFNRPVSLVGFAVVGLAGGTTLVEYGREAVDRSRRRGEHPLQALYHLFGRNRRKYGGYLVHAGVILMALGIIGTRVYPFETEMVLSSGEPADVQGYTLVYEDLRQDSADDHFSTRASVSVYRDGAYLTTLQPQMDQYLNYDQTVAVPALRAGLREDLYLVLAGWETGGERATLKVFVNPLAGFLWLGGLVFLAGGAVALWPAARPARLPAPEARRRGVGTAVGLAAGLLVLVAAGLAMWGPGGGVAAQRVGRPLPGQPAPDFTLNLLDGSMLALSELRGQVVVVNFWATWCPPCEDELPDLQAVWTEYQAQGVVFVGIAFQEEEVAVREMASRFGLTYALGLDLGDRISTAFGITAVPETFVIDAQGQVAYVHIGPVTGDELRGELDSLLQQ
jgi:peroxiredoxin